MVRLDRIRVGGMVVVEVVVERVPLLQPKQQRMDMGYFGLMSLMGLISIWSK